MRSIERSWPLHFKATVNKNQCETSGLFLSLVIHYSTE